MPAINFSNRIDTRLYSNNGTYLNISQVEGSLGNNYPWTPVQEYVKNNLPHWKQYQKEHGFLPVLPYEAYRRDTLGAFIGIRGTLVKNPAYVGNYWAGIVDSYAYEVAPLKADILALYPNQRNVAINVAKAKFSQHLSGVEWDALVDVAEADKTAKLLLNTVRNTYSYYKNFRTRNGEFYRHAMYQLKQLLPSSSRPLSSSNLKALKPLARALNDKYLEFTYGWKPLIRSVEDASQFVVKTMNPHTHKIKFSGKGEFVEKLTTNKYNLNTFCRLDYEYNQILHYQCWVGGLLKNEQELSALSRLGIALDNIPSVLWELTRFSFLVDYVVNVGDFINNVKNTSLLVQPVTLYLSEKYQFQTDLKKYKYTPNGTGPQPSNLIVGDVTNIPFNAEYFRRSVLSVPNSRVSLTLRSPSAKSMINSLSVAASVLKLFK